MWDIKDSLYLKYQNQLEDVNYILRIIELDEAEYSTDAIVDFFDIGIKKGETSRYVSLPHEESFYCVEFVLLSDSKEIIIDRSRIVKTTRDHINYVLDDNAKLKKIVELSGYSNCDIIEESRKSLNRILPMDSMDEEE